MNPFTAIINYFKDDVIRSPEDLRKALEDRPNLKIYEVPEKPAELKIFDGLSGEEMPRPSWLEAFKIQLEARRNKRK